MASERNGRWSKAMEVPGLSKLDKGENAQVVSASCGSAGDCAVGGHYFTGSGNREQGFVAVERNGRWGTATEVKGLAALNQSGYAAVLSVSCTEADTCSAGGFYSDNSHRVQGFAATEKDGRWDTAAEIPGLGALNTRGNAQVESVSCASAGNCAASGHYTTVNPIAEQGFVASERNGRRTKAIEVPGLGALNTGGDADVPSVSCDTAGNCVAGGGYATANPAGGRGFVAVERNGRWGTALAVSKGAASEVSSVSCALAGKCEAGGTYDDSAGRHMFMVSEQNGHLGTAVELPSPNPAAGGTVTTLSCGSAGNCAAGGNFLGSEQRFYGFVASERNGTWGTSIEMPSMMLGTLSSGRSASMKNGVP